MTNLNGIPIWPDKNKPSKIIYSDASGSAGRCHRSGYARSPFRHIGHITGPGEKCKLLYIIKKVRIVQHGTIMAFSL